MIRLNPLSRQQMPAEEARQRRQAQFSGAEAAVKEAAEAGIKNVAHLREANGLYKIFGKLSSIELRAFNLSLEDWAGRFLTVFGIYIPQAYYSFKENRHKWETNGRNALVWTMTLAIAILSKSEKFGVNLLLNQFMKGKGDSDPNLKGFRKSLDKFFDKFRLERSYFELLDDAGIKYTEADKKKAYWSKLDDNAIQTVVNRHEGVVKTMEKLMETHGISKKELADYISKTEAVRHGVVKETEEALGKKVSRMSADELAALVKKVEEKAGKSLLDKVDDAHVVEKLRDHFKLNKSYNKFLRRSNLFRMLNTAIITAAIVYVVGGLAMKIILKTVAPLDPDFNPEGGKKKQQPVHQQVKQDLKEAIAPKDPYTNTMGSPLKRPHKVAEQWEQAVENRTPQPTPQASRQQVTQQQRPQPQVQRPVPYQTQSPGYPQPQPQPSAGPVYQPPGWQQPSSYPAWQNPSVTPAPARHYAVPGTFQQPPAWQQRPYFEGGMTVESPDQTPALTHEEGRV